VPALVARAAGAAPTTRRAVRQACPSTTRFPFGLILTCVTLVLVNLGHAAPEYDALMMRSARNVLATAPQ
jgi:hypothetical protein